MTRSKSSRSGSRLATRLLGTPFIFFILALFVLLLYGRSLTSWAVADDLLHLRAALSQTIPLQNFFRPLERFVNELDVRWLGYDNLILARSVNLLGFFIALVATYKLGRLIRPDSAVASAFAVALLAVSPQATLSVIQIDTISQQYATVFALFFLLSLFAAVRRQSRGFYLLSYSFAFLALLSKETAPGIIATVPLAVGLIGLHRGVYKSRRQVLQTLLLNYLGVAVVAALYVAVRLAFGYSFGGEDSGRYDLALSVGRLSKNFVLYVASLLYSGGSSLDIFPILKPWRVAVSSLFTLTLLLVSFIGVLRLVLARSLSTTSLLALFLLVLAGSFPVILTGQVSELYVYSSLPFYVLLLSFCFTGGVGALSRRLRAAEIRYAAVVFVLCLIGWLSYGTSEKVSLIMQANSQSWRYFTQASTFFEATPSKTFKFCWLKNQDEAVSTYSTYFLPHFRIAEKATYFAAVVDKRAFSLFSSSNNAVVLYGPSAPSTVNRRPCDYWLSLAKEGLQFQK